MTRNDIIRMAREAGSIDSEDVIETVYAAFAATEREACAQLCEERKHYWQLEGSRADENAYCAEAIRARGNT